MDAREKPMVEASCHCGAVSLSVKTEPREVTECNCSICRRLGARWAYYSPTEVTLPKAGTTQPYVWGDRMLAFHRCKSCGVTTHWQSLDGSKDRMAINARTMGGLDWDKISVRQFDGATTWEYMDA
jgi:hypothetical protein